MFTNTYISYILIYTYTYVLYIFLTRNVYTLKKNLNLIYFCFFTSILYQLNSMNSDDRFKQASITCL